MNTRGLRRAATLLVGLCVVTICTCGELRAGVFNRGLESSSAALPPKGSYLSDYGTEFSSLGIEIAYPRHNRFENVDRVAIGNDELETFDSTFTAVVTVGGVHSPVKLTGPVQTLVTDRNLSTTGLFDAEIVSMSLSGSMGGQPIMVREDPSMASAGATDIQDLGGGLYHIDSFFDVFTELSVDGGSNWVAADSAARLTLGNQAIEVPNGDLPPADGEYQGQYPVEYDPDRGLFPQGITIAGLRHGGFSNVLRMAVGSDEVETFDSILTGIVTTGGASIPVTLTGPVETIVYDKVGNTTGTFDAEIVSMSLSGDVGGIPIVIREDALLASPGETTITDLGGGLYHIDSFFDVFTELSVDGGDTWSPATNGSVRMVLDPTNVIPEPSTVILLALGALGLVMKRSRASHPG